MTAMNLSHVDLLKLLSETRTQPHMSSGGPGELSELPPVLGKTTTPSPIETLSAAPDEISVPVRALHFSKVFVIWRPYESCKRCKEEINSETLILPTTGDYTCEHVQNAEYKRVMDNCLAGKGVFMLREHFNLVNGTRVAHVEWCELDPEYIKEQRAKEEEARKNSIAPTFGTGDIGQ